MLAFDDRLLRVSFNIKGKIYQYTELEIEITGTKFASQIANSANIKITGLDKDMISYITQTTSPFIANYDSWVLVEVGRKSYGYTTVFTGKLFRSSVTQPPDISINIRCMTNFNEKPTSIYFNKVSLKTIASTIVNNYNLMLDFQATDIYISNFSVQGNLQLQIRELAKLTNDKVYTDNDTLYVIDVNSVNTTFTLDKDNGMIGIPQFTSAGIRVNCLFDPRIKIGQNVTIKSVINPAVNGTYRVFKLTFNLANRSKPFYYTIDALEKKL
jgi:hypothetical protein